MKKYNESIVYNFCSNSTICIEKALIVVSHMGVTQLPLHGSISFIIGEDYYTLRWDIPQ